MYLGQISEIAPTSELWDHPRHPYTDALLSAVPVPDPDHADRRERIILVGDVPSPVAPPSGCRFHPRCPKAAPTCVEQEPVLEPRLGDGPDHRTKCHFPVADGEDLSLARPTISADARIVETGILAGDDTSLTALGSKEES